MKAAVLFKLGEAPKYEDFKEPILENENQLLMLVKAASIKNIDKLRASGKHYASYTQLPTVVGLDAVGVLENGQHVYANGLTGTFAEKTLIAANNYVVLPENLDFALAAALPNALLGSALALLYKAGFKKGDTVLINGATGVTGYIAVQVAKHYGAGKIIITGRNTQILEQLLNKGANVAISLQQEDEAIIQKIKTIHQEQPINIVLDYLWGHPVSLIIKAFKSSGIHHFTPTVKIVSIGSMAAEGINLESGWLRSSAIEILGSGIGSLSQHAMDEFNKQILPEMFQLAAKGKLDLPILITSIEHIETNWQLPVPKGKRLVVCI